MGALLQCCVGQARIPCEWHRNRPPVFQIDNQIVIVTADTIHTTRRSPRWLRGALTL